MVCVWDKSLVVYVASWHYDQSAAKATRKFNDWVLNGVISQTGLMISILEEFLTVIAKCGVTYFGMFSVAAMWSLFFSVKVKNIHKAHRNERNITVLAIDVIFPIAFKRINVENTSWPGFSNRKCVRMCSIFHTMQLWWFAWNEQSIFIRWSHSWRHL